MVDFSDAAEVVKVLGAQIQQAQATHGAVGSELAQVQQERAELEQRLVEVRSKESSLRKEEQRLSALIEKAQTAQRDARVLAGVR